MAIENIDRNQTRTVAVLLCILVLAVGVTGYRIKSRSVRPQQMVPAADKASSDLAKTKGRAEAEGFSSALASARFRNPFAAPKTPATVANSSKPVSVRPLPLGAPNGIRPFDSWSRKDWVKVVAVENRPPVSKTGMQDEKAISDVSRDEPNSARFILLATVTSSRGCSAVIQCDGSVVQTVEVGDVLCNGFRVVNVNRDEAVLTDGVKTIVARRPG